MLFLMWLGCHGCLNEIDPMMSLTWLSISAKCEILVWPSVRIVRFALLTNHEVSIIDKIRGFASI